MINFLYVWSFIILLHIYKNKKKNESKKDDHVLDPLCFLSLMPDQRTAFEETRISRRHDPDAVSSVL